MNSNIRLENTYITLPKEFYTEQLPSKVPSPSLVKWNSTLAVELELDSEFFQSKEGALVLSGNHILEDTIPIAEAYAGHQFGYFTMLGDGRAVLLGEIVTKDEERYDIQLKGSGRTPYSRGGDGKATLGPMLREYIISEGMKGLGIPSTRSLAVLTTGETILRETTLPGAILVRVAKSHIRVGTFQFANQFLDTKELKALADYTIKRHYKEIFEKEEKYRHFLHEVVKNQAKLIAQWQLVGFIHGVMNTDNMTISGETIDYGPCAFMDTYHPETVFSSIDTEGRYAYQNQPKMASWDLARLAEALVPLLHDNKEKAIEIAQEEINQFSKLYLTFWFDGMRKKLGLFHENEMDEDLIEALLSLMVKYEADYTNTFRDLTLNQTTQSNLVGSTEYQQWLDLWLDRRKQQEESMDDSRKLMESVNPTVIPRNHRVEEALERAVDYQDYNAMDSLVSALQHPYDYKNQNDYYTTPPGESSCGYRTFCGT